MPLKLKDMAKTEEERKKDMPMMAALTDQSIYPYGLCISLDDETLEKLGLDDDCEPGDHINLSALAKVTSVSKNDTADGQRCRVELQITHLGTDEDEEEEEEEESPRMRLRPRYRG